MQSGNTQRKGETSDELPPHNVELERQALGCVFASSPSAGLEMLRHFDIADFYELRYHLIYTHLLQCPGEDTLESELTVRLTAAGDLPAIGGIEGIFAVVQSVTTGAAIDIVLPKLKELSRRRAVIKYAKRLWDHAIDTMSDMELLPTMAAQQGAAIETRAWVDLLEVPEAHESIVIGPGRWAGRGGSTLLVGGTGFGKSTLIATLSHAFAIGRPWLGLVPNGPLKSVVIQAEDDDGDLAAMSTGICYALNPNEEEMELIRRNVRVVTESAITGIAFLNKRVRPLLRQEKPDLLWLNPLHSYSGMDLKETENVALFCRNTLNPMLQAAGCHCFIAHHTPKPPREGKGYADLDLAYAGAGSADLANWAREVIVLQSRAPKLFDMYCVKRGQHLGWKDADGNATRSKTITYGENSAPIHRGPLAHTGVETHDASYTIRRLPVPFGRMYGCTNGKSGRVIRLRSAQS